MKPAPFTLHRPTTLREALSILSDVCDDGGLVLAGGQSLVPMMALRVAYPPHLVDINGIPELTGIEVVDGRLAIGAGVRHAQFHRPVEPGSLGVLLAEVSRHIAHYPIRMRGTFCGSLAHADPASEWCLVSRTLDAEMRLASVDGERTVTAVEFFLGAMTTIREPNEILVGVSLPLLDADATFGFYEFNRRAGDFAIGSCLATFSVTGGVMRDVRVGVGGIEENPRRIGEAEAVLEGQVVDERLFAEAGAAGAAAVDAMEDASTSAQYRRELTAVVIWRALTAALARQTSETESHPHG